VGDRTSLVTSSFDGALVLLAEDLAPRWVSRAQADRVVRLAHRFASFCTRRFGVTALDAVTPAMAAAFVAASTGDGESAGPSLQRSRRDAVRSLYRVARAGGLAASDPTLDVPLSPQSSLRARPLTDDEIAECRGASQWAIGSTRRSATLALAEATCRSGEIPNVLVGDVDPGAGTVRIQGGGRCAPRIGHLTSWGIEQVRARLAAIENDSSKRLVYRGSDSRLGGLVSANSTITQVLERAGVAGEPDVRPSSVVAWAGTQVLESTGRIEDVARALGLRSLDGAATFIGWQWLEADGDDPN